MHWQPIETAPRDGTEFLAWNPRQSGTYLVCFDDDRWMAADDCPYAWNVLLSEPTHWMPLPAPPTQAEKGQDKT